MRVVPIASFALAACTGAIGDPQGEVFVRGRDLPQFRSVQPACGSGGHTDAPGMHDIALDPSHYFAWVPDSYDPSVPMRTLISLHGDEGDPTMSVVYFWGDHWMAHRDYILIMPQVAYGRPSWYSTDAEPNAQEENGAWMDMLLADASARWNIDLRRLYFVGLSGGAWFQSIYMMGRQDRIAAIAFTLGGAGSPEYFYQSPADDACKIPARFTEGTADFLYDPARMLYEYLTSHGHTTEWVDLPGLDHNFAMPPTEQVDRNFAWLTTRELCEGTVCPMGTR